MAKIRSLVARSKISPSSSTISACSSTSGSLFEVTIVRFPFLLLWDVFAAVTVTARFAKDLSAVGTVWRSKTDIFNLLDGVIWLLQKVTSCRTETSERRGIVGLEISMRERGDVGVLDLLGRSTIDGGESELLSKHLRNLIAKGKRKLLLNLLNLSQIDSSGVSIIVEMFVSLKRSGGELKLLSPRGRVLNVLKVFRLLDIIPSFDDETEALENFRARGIFAIP